ncbi:MAG TPA: RNA-binding protein [Casimicrobiaceae bacterium]|jgi:hypothetical protein|nr:RNA-binding protein [Casimicrobiaceae bacterium]
MERLWIANLAPGTTDEELKALCARYAPDLECMEVRREEGDGSRPAAVMSFSGKSIDSLSKLKRRLDGLYWKERRLSCSTTVL